MEENFNIWSILVQSSAIYIILSAIGGIVLPFLSNIFSSTTERYLALSLSLLEGTGVLVTLCITDVLVGASQGLFTFFAKWHILLLFSPMIRHIRGRDTDDALLQDLAITEWRLLFYFSPTIFATVLSFLWSARNIVLVTLVTLIGMWKVLPRRWIGLLLYYSVQPAIWHNNYDMNIRGSFLRAYDSVIGGFDRFEIAIARRRREHRSPPHERYGYVDLETPRHIRLLRLRRRIFFSEPICEIFSIALDEAPPFEAISHTWGREDPSNPLVVGTHRTLVTSSIDEFLFHQRSIFRSKIFWIDSICINQGSNNERDQQVALMAEIYRRAVLVIVWLGPPTSIQDTHLTRKLIRALSWPTIYYSKIQLIESLFPSQQAAFAATAQLFTHPWFERIWVLQEVALGQAVHVMYRGVRVEWTTLLDAAKEIASDADLSNLMQGHMHMKSTEDGSRVESTLSIPSQNQSPVFHWSHVTFMAYVRDSVQSGQMFALGPILMLTMSLKATIAKDKLFGVLGLTADHDKFELKPSYTDSTELVFMKAATLAHKSNDWFTLLITAGRGYESLTTEIRSSLLDMSPSWVPDFSSDTISGMRAGRPADAESRDTEGKLSFIWDPTMAQLEAVVFDRVERLTSRVKFRTEAPSLPDGNLSMEDFKKQFQQILATGKNKAKRDWYLEARQLAHQFLTQQAQSDEKADQEFWEVCMSCEEGSDTTQNTESLPSPLLSSMRLLFERFLLTDPEEFFNDIDEFVRNQQLTAEAALKIQGRLMRRFDFSTLGKAFCATSRKSIGLVPPLAREGDLLAHVRGGYVPVVLRQREVGKNVATFIGSCYIHGVGDTYSGSDWTDWFLE